MSSGSFDGGSKSLDKLMPNSTDNDNATDSAGEQIKSTEMIGRVEEIANGNHNGKAQPEDEDFVSGTLYDILQKEVIALRKACHDKDQSLKEKDDAIEVDGFASYTMIIYAFLITGFVSEYLIFAVVE